jgi:hypothetical protein
MLLGINEILIEVSASELRASNRDSAVRAVSEEH